MKINEKIIAILEKISEKRKTQDNYGTNTPIYLVQARKEKIVDPEYETVEIKRMYIPEISCEGFAPTFDQIKDGALRETDLPYEFLLELEDCGSIEEMQRFFRMYFPADCVYSYAQIINKGYYWQTVAYFLVLEEAKKYQQYQKHNLGTSRVYVDYAGYDNKELFAQLLETLDNEEFYIAE